LASGDASYAIYLTHGFVVPMVGLVVKRVGVSGGIALTAAVIGGSLLASAAVGWVTYVILERPTLALFRRQPSSVRLTTILSKARPIVKSLYSSK
jgi:exopolysaccharide production protein ExoZ